MNSSCLMLSDFAFAFAFTCVFTSHCIHIAVHSHCIALHSNCIAFALHCIQTPARRTHCTKPSCPPKRHVSRRDVAAPHRSRSPPHSRARSPLRTESAVDRRRRTSPEPPSAPARSRSLRPLLSGPMDFLRRIQSPARSASPTLPQTRCSPRAHQPGPDPVRDGASEPATPSCAWQQAVGSEASRRSMPLSVPTSEQGKSPIKNARSQDL